MTRHSGEIHRQWSRPLTHIWFHSAERPWWSMGAARKVTGMSLIIAGVRKKNVFQLGGAVGTNRTHLFFNDFCRAPQHVSLFECVTFRQMRLFASLASQMRRVQWPILYRDWLVRLRNEQNVAISKQRWKAEVNLWTTKCRISAWKQHFTHLLSPVQIFTLMELFWEPAEK